MTGADTFWVFAPGFFGGALEKMGLMGNLGLMGAEITKFISELIIFCSELFFLNFQSVFSALAI